MGLEGKGMRWHWEATEEPLVRASEGTCSTHRALSAVTGSWTMAPVTQDIPKAITVEASGQHGQVGKLSPGSLRQGQRASSDHLLEPNSWPRKPKQIQRRRGSQNLSPSGLLLPFSTVGATTRRTATFQPHPLCHLTDTCYGIVFVYIVKTMLLSLV